MSSVDMMEGTALTPTDKEEEEELVVEEMVVEEDEAGEIAAHRRNDMLRHFGLLGGWGGEWEGAVSDDRGESRGGLGSDEGGAPLIHDDLWQRVLDEKSTAGILADIGRIDDRLSAEDHKYAVRWDFRLLSLSLACLCCSKEIKVLLPGNTRGEAPLKNWKRHCGGSTHLRKAVARVAAAAEKVEGGGAGMAVDEEEAALRDKNRSGVYIPNNPGTMSIRRYSFQSGTVTLAPQPAPAHVVDPVTHLAGYPGVFVADVRSSTYFCLVCKENLPGLFNAAFEHNTHLHVTTGKHARIVKDRRESGGGLARFGIGAAAEMDVAGATMPTLSRKQHECCGNWRPQCRIGGVEYDMSLLAGRDGAGFYFSQLLPRSLETAAPGVAAVVGTSVSVDGSTGTVVSGASDWAGGMLVSFGGGSTGSTSGGTGSLSSSSSSSSSSTGQVTRSVDAAGITTASVQLPAVTYRSSACSWSCVDAVTGEVDQWLMCQNCRSLPKLTALRQRLYRASDNTGEIDEKTRLDYYPPPLLLERAQELASEAREKDKRIFRLERMLLQSKQRAAKMKERLNRSFLEGNAKRMVADLEACAKAGTLGDATAVSFISDLIHAHRLSTTNGGKGRKVMRWSEASKRIFTILVVYGGPKSLRLFSKNVEGVSRSTTQRLKRGLEYHYMPGTHEGAIMYIAEVYKPMVEALDLPEGEVILAETAEDETGILADLEYDHQRDAVLGGCGREGANHKCDFSHMRVLGSDGGAAAGTVAAEIDDECDHIVRSGYLRLVLINPLHERLPPMIVSLSPTCNKFTADDVQAQWDEMHPLLIEHLSPIGIEVIGCASDGDARRFKKQKQQMSAEPGAGYSKFQIDHPSLTLHGRKHDETGVVDRIHSQDDIHNDKKGYNASDNACRFLCAGEYEISHNHNRESFKRFGPEATMMDKSAVARDDRQNDDNVVRAVSTGATTCLAKMQHQHQGIDGKTYAPVRTQGSVWYFTIIRRAARMHRSMAMTALERVEAASYVLNSLRFWKNHVYYGKNTLTLKANFLANQTYNHMCLECQSVMATVKLMGTKHPSQPVDLRKKGSDSCETTFSRLGGHGDIQAGRRNFTFAKALNLAGTVSMLARFGCGDGGLDLSNPNRKADYKAKYHDPPEEEDEAARAAVSLERRRHPGAAELVAAVEAGLVAARGDATALGMGLTGSEEVEALMASPWLSDDKAALSSAMRDADDADDAGQSLIGMLVEVTRSGDTCGCTGIAVGFDSGAYLVDLKGLGGASLGRHHFTRAQLEPIAAVSAAAAVVEAGPDADLADAVAAASFESVLDRLGDAATAALEEEAKAAADGGEEEAEDEGENDDDGDGDGDDEQGQGQAAVAAAVAKAPCTCTVVRNGTAMSIHKSTYLNEQKQQRKGKRLETDRLRRVQTAALQHLSGLFGSGEGVMVLEYGAHFALKVGGGGWWLGRATQVLRPAGSRGCKVAIHGSVTLEDAQSQGVVVTGSYFRREVGGTFTHAPKGDGTCTDGAQYSAVSIMVLVELKYEETTDAGDHVYKFDDPELVGKLDALAKVGEKEAATAAEKEKKQAKSRKRKADESGESETGAGRGAQEAKKAETTVPGTSRSGRATLRGLVT